MQKLIEHNHRLRDIENYTLDQFVLFLDAAERAEAVSRLAFTIDIGAVVGCMFGSKDIFKNHLDSLQSIANGESNDG